MHVHKVRTTASAQKWPSRCSNIAGFTSHANLGFWFGSNTHDPYNLLEGTGKRLRHVKLRTLQDVDRPALRELLQSSLAHQRASI